MHKRACLPYGAQGFRNGFQWRIFPLTACGFKEVLPRSAFHEGIARLRHFLMDDDGVGNQAEGGIFRIGDRQ